MTHAKKTKITWIGLLVFTVGLRAEDDSKPVTFGGFENQGSVTLGYRLTDVYGYQPGYTQMFGLRSGFRLMDFNDFGKATNAGNKFLDSYSLTANGIGGEPFTNIQLTLRKTHLYELRANFRQSYYYWDQSSVLNPSAIPGAANNHSWATVRKLGSLNLLVHATNNLRFSLEYFRNSQDGVTFTTQSLNYFGQSSTWGAFARADPYIMIAPVSILTNRATAGMDYTIGEWALHYRVGYQNFSEAVNGANPTSPEKSLNTSDPTTAAELLTGANWINSRKLTTPVSEFSYNGKILPRLEARGGYIFYRYSGPAALNMSMDGVARTNSSGTADAPYLVTLSTTAKVDEPNQIVDQGFTYKAARWWNVLADYRYSRFAVNSTALFESDNGPTVSTGTSENQWRIGTSSFDFGMTFTPTRSFSLRAEVSYVKSDVLVLEDGVADPLQTRRLKSVWPVGSFYYQPSKMFSIRGDADQNTSGTAYTAVSPHTDVGGRFVARFRPNGKLTGFYLEDAGAFRDRTQLITTYHSTIRSNAATANYEFNEKFAIYAGLSYDSAYTTELVSFLRGTAPFTNLPLTDQTVNRVWQGGVRLSPAKRLGMNFTGNFVRSTGLGQIAGEAPLSGPMSFPYATGSLHYDFPKMGRLTLQLQRTYYIEQLISSNNFSANLLTILYTRSF